MPQAIFVLKPSVFFELNAVFLYFFACTPLHASCMKGRKKNGRPKNGRILPLFGGLKSDEKKKKNLIVLAVTGGRR